MGGNGWVGGQVGGLSGWVVGWVAMGGLGGCVAMGDGKVGLGGLWWWWLAVVVVVVVVVVRWSLV